MTEAEWLASTDVQAMYVFLRDTTTLFRTRWQGPVSVPRFVFSERKSRLFAVACCRRILHLMPTDEARQCVLTAEAYADGLADEDELRASIEASMRSVDLRGYPQPVIDRAAIEALGRVHRHESGRFRSITAAATAWALSTLVELREEYTPENQRALQAAEQARQADLLRDIIGNPFQPSTVDPSWLAWNDRCVERIAHGIYEERAFERLPILADALLDAGCDDEAILAHCRSPGPHVLGCWAVDLILAKK